MFVTVAFYSYLVPVAVFPTLEHDDYDPGPLAERIRRDTGRDHSSDDFS